jgi:hypothetical protein
MKKSLLLIVLLATSLLMSAQDIIVRNNGSKIHCKVLEIDSTRIYYDIGNDIFKYNIKRNQVKEILYGNPSQKSVPDTEPQNAVTVGFLEGGGSLIGVDGEFLYSKIAGVQLGVGFKGFGAGLTLHFRPTIRSSFFSLQYWHQGFKNSYTQSVLGPSIVLRAKKLFTAQIGVGFALGKGPAWPENKTQPHTMLTYAIGLYFPFKNF